MKKTSFKKARRDFLVTSAGVGGGIALGFHMPSALAQKTGAAESADVNIWVAVNTDDTVVIKYARSEMGQGSMTSAPQLVAEELDADWKKVTVEYADTNQHVRMKRAWGDMASVGSRTIRMSQEYLRKAGASARAMLVAAAANEWKVPAGEITVSNGVISHAASKRRTTFGKLAAAAAKLEAPKNVVLKDPKDWKIAGKSMRRIDIPKSVNGTQIYGADVQLPGMLYAAVAQCPVFGGKAKSFDDSRVKSRRGIVKVVSMTTARRWRWWPTTGGGRKKRSRTPPWIGTWAPMAMCRAPASCNSSRTDWWRRMPPCCPIAKETTTRRLPARPRFWRPSTSPPIFAMHPWSPWARRYRLRMAVSMSGPQPNRAKVRWPQWLAP